MTSALPFDDFRSLMQALPEGDDAAAARLRAVFARAAKPGQTLGRLEAVAEWLARSTGSVPPAVNRPLVAIFAGTHGVIEHGVSARSFAATAEDVDLCAAGGAAINQVCLSHGLGLKVFDLALHLPTGDITREAAFDEPGCAATMAFGMEAVGGGTDLLCLGDLGVGNSTVAAAIFCMLYGGNGVDWVSGIDAELAQRKADAVDAAVALHGAHRGDPFEVLRRVGGREFAAIVGAIIAARAERVPVVLDGHAAIAAAAILHALRPDAIAHCALASKPAEPGAARAARHLGLTPLLDLQISYGEGVGAALAAGIVKAAAQVASGFFEVQKASGLTH